jgi:hypothetical protein
MSGSYFVVDHLTDETKRDGLLESYQMLPVSIQQEDGTVTTGYRRLNFVHWPGIPAPFVHEEWSEDLAFSNIYTPSLDETDEDEDEEDYGDDEDGEDDELTFDGEEVTGLEG